MSGRHHTSLFTSLPVDFLGFILLMQFRYLGQGGGGGTFYFLLIYIYIVSNFIRVFLTGYFIGFVCVYCVCGGGVGVLLLVVVVR